MQERIRGGVGAGLVQPATSQDGGAGLHDRTFTPVLGLIIAVIVDMEPYMH